MDTNHWLWLFGGVFAAALVVSAMGRRQSRLTEVLKNYVTRTQEKQKKALEKQSDAETP